MSFELFESLKRLKNIVDFILLDCRMGNETEIMHSLSLEKLMVLNIEADPMGNRGFKKLMKLHLPNLVFCCVRNTNCTTDSLRLLSKTTSRKLREFNFAAHPSFSDLLRMKQVPSLFNRGSWFIFQIDYRQARPEFVYPGHLCKFKGPKP